MLRRQDDLETVRRRDGAGMRDFRRCIACAFLKAEKDLTVLISEKNFA
jgi:hypothetical protein